MTIGCRTALIFLLGILTVGGPGRELVRAEAMAEIHLPFLERQERALRWGRDPFALPGRSGQGLADSDGEFHLSAIIYRPGRGGLAIINNKILQRGDTIEGRQILDIMEDRVIIAGGSGGRELKVRKFVMGR